MSLQAFDYIYEAMSLYFGSIWLVWVAIGLFLFAVFFATLRVPVVVLIPVIGLPLIVLTFYGVIVTGWIVTVIVLALGLLLAIGLTRLFVR